ncbi:hypothetical protein ZWY2020_045056 [Hordeum vulgare]|nr:hypothetical protein ZWY2020_045056 [Hordeum vulgare]
MCSSTWWRCHALAPWTCATSETQPCTMFKCLEQCRARAPGIVPHPRCDPSVHPEQCCCRRHAPPPTLSDSHDG